MIRQADRVRSVSLHDVDLVVAVTAGGEGDLASIRRPVRKAFVEIWQIGQVGLVAAVGVHHVDIGRRQPEVCVDDLL